VRPVRRALARAANRDHGVEGRLSNCF